MTPCANSLHRTLAYLAWRRVRVVVNAGVVKTTLSLLA